MDGLKAAMSGWGDGNFLVHELFSIGLFLCFCLVFLFKTVDTPPHDQIGSYGLAEFLGLAVPTLP